MATENNSNPLVTIITATIGREHLARCIRSVQAQTYKNIQHFIAIDGKQHEEGVRKVFSQFANKKHPLTRVDVLSLPYSTLAFGGRIYASTPHLTLGDFIMNLDDDNFIEPDHVQSLVDVIDDRPWAYSLRNITTNGKFVMRDDCASLGPLHPLWDAMRNGVLSETFVDTNCYLLKRKTAIELSSNWAAVEFSANPYRNDRMFYDALLSRYPNHACTFRHTLNYEVIHKEHLDYVAEGNKWMYDQYGDDLPWRNAKLASSFLHHGIFEFDTREGLYFDEPLADEILSLFPVKPKSVADVGCGPGYYCAHFTRNGNWDVQGYEGNPNALSHGLWDKIEQTDLAIRDPKLPTYELAISLEVGEHIPKEFESNFIDNLVQLGGKTIILSWAVKGQGGTGHFNEQDNPYIISQIEKRGFSYDTVASDKLRNAASLQWFKNTIMVFHRIEYKNPTAANYLTMSSQFHQSSQFEKAISAARSALTLKPDFAAAYNNICAANNRLGNFVEGKKAGEEAVRLDPSNQLFKNNLKWAVDELNKR